MHCPATPEFAQFVQNMESDDIVISRSAVEELNKSEAEGNLQTFDIYQGAIDCTVSCLACGAVVGISTSIQEETPATTVIAGACPIVMADGQQGRL